MKTLVTAPRNSSGQFERIHLPWDLSRFDDGYVDSDGRFRVYLPNHPRASAGGYVLRAIVAYELYHPTEVITQEFAIHHCDKNRLNDSPDNLEKKSFGLHSSEHNKGRGLGFTARVCQGCSRIFSIGVSRLHDMGRGQYCSQTCYHSVSKYRGGVVRVQRICEFCATEFSVRATVLKNKPGFGRFCSHSCSAKERWAKCA